MSHITQLWVPTDAEHVERVLDRFREAVRSNPCPPAYIAAQAQTSARLTEQLRAVGVDPADEAQAQALKVGMLLALGAWEVNDHQDANQVRAVVGASVLRVTEGLMPPTAVVA